MKIINLLPRDRQQELRYEKMYRSMVRFAELSAITFVVVFALQFMTRLYLGQQARVLNTEIEQAQRSSNKQENATLKQRIKTINTEIGDYNLLAMGTPAWSRVLAAFAAQMPEGMTLDTFKADLVKKKIDVHGISPSRELVIQLYNNISRDDKEFFNIDYPLENVQRATEVPFHFTFFIKDELLKEPAP
jgi:hypothetical protein